MIKLRLVTLFSVSVLMFASGGFGLDAAPRCGSSPARPLPPNGLATGLSDWLIPNARADLAPGPEDPCYQIKEGGACISSDGEPGTCVQSCYDQLDPGTGKKMYQKCHVYCRGGSQTPVQPTPAPTAKPSAKPKSGQ